MLSCCRRCFVLRVCNGIYGVRETFAILLLAACLFLSGTRPALGAAPPQANAATQAQLDADRGLQLAQAGRLAEAESEFRQAAHLSPRDPEILTSLGTVLAMQRKLDESSRFFDQALKLSPRNQTARRYLAANLWQLRRFPEAKTHLQILLRQNPKDEEARLLLGMVSENTRDYETAVHLLSSVPERVRRQPESVAALAHSYYQVGDQQKARATLGLLSQNFESLPAIALGAQIAEQARDYDAAETMLQSVQLKFPQQPDLAYRLAVVQYRAGKLDAAQNTLTNLVDGRHANSDVYNLLGWCYYKRDQLDEAVAALNQAISLAPNNELSYVDLTKILMARKSLPAALAVVRRATVALPESANLFSLRGSIESKVGQFSDAVGSYSRALELDSSRPDSLVGLGEAQFSAGMTREAISTYEKAIKRFPRDARILVSYGTVLTKQAAGGDAQAGQRAEEMFQTALKLDPGSSQAHYELGKRALQVGAVTIAVHHLQEAVKLSPTSGEVHFVLARAYRRAGRPQDATREMQEYEKLKGAASGPPLAAERSATQDKF